jgi:hypothetical protein
MSTVDNYLDKIMSNHVFNSDSSEDLSYLYSEKENYEDENEGENEKGMIGGKDGNTENKNDSNYDGPTGGFPPIFIVSAKEKEEEKSKNRRLTNVAGKVSVSIKDILKSKK